MSLKDFKSLIQTARQVTVTSYPLNSRTPVTSARVIAEMVPRGIYTFLPPPRSGTVYVDWPTGPNIRHRIEGRRLTWIGKNGQPLFSYHFPLSLEEALAEV